MHVIYNSLEYMWNLNYNVKLIISDLYKMLEFFLSWNCPVSTNQICQHLIGSCIQLLNLSVLNKCLQGGQILRIASALSCVTKQPLTVDKIRAGRSKPGLRYMTHVVSAVHIVSCTIFFNYIIISIAIRYPHCYHSC